MSFLRLKVQKCVMDTLKAEGVKYQDYGYQRMVYECAGKTTYSKDVVRNAVSG